jgi:hypothetical protein
MTFTRLVLVLVAGLVLTDYQFGNGRLIQEVSAQTTDLIYRMNDTFVRVVRRVAPYH